MTKGSIDFVTRSVIFNSNR